MKMICFKYDTSRSFLLKAKYIKGQFLLCDAVYKSRPVFNFILLLDAQCLRTGIRDSYNGMLTRTLSD